MRSKRARLSRTEWEIMKICWKKGKSTVRAIYEETIKVKKRRYQAVKTMLDRMENKGYLRREKFGPLCLYEPIVSQSKEVSSAIDHFIDTVLDGAIAPLFTYFAKGEELGDEDIRKLKCLIEKSEREEDHGKSK